MPRSNTVSQQRRYSVLDVQAAKGIALVWLERHELEHAISFGLPEVDDRYHIWRVPLLNASAQERIGEVVIDAYTSLVLEDKSTAPDVLEARWNIRAHPNQELVEASRIGDDYERTNIWRITPAHDPRHPAVFPVELAERVITYYSFKGDVVLDPFAGTGTVGKAASRLGRRFVLIEQDAKYVAIMREEAKTWFGKDATQILTSPEALQLLSASGTDV